MDLPGIWNYRILFCNFASFVFLHHSYFCIIRILLMRCRQTFTHQHSRLMRPVFMPAFFFCIRKRLLRFFSGRPPDHLPITKKGEDISQSSPRDKALCLSPPAGCCAPAEHPDLSYASIMRFSINDVMDRFSRSAISLIMLYAVRRMRK